MPHREPQGGHLRSAAGDERARSGDTLAAAIDADEADVYIVNFANCDMVGHTGVVDAARAAVEAVDAGVGRVLAAIERKGGVALVTADHGNADKMIAEDGGAFTAHTTNPVPLVLVDASGSDLALSGAEGCLADIAPTLLAMIGPAAAVRDDRREPSGLKSFRCRRVTLEGAGGIGYTSQLAYAKHWKRKGSVTR